MDVIFTIVSRNYAAQAATLMQSLAAHEPAARRVVVATDGPIPQLEPLAEVIEAGALGAPADQMRVYYDALEFNTAVKPFVMRTLLAQPGVDSVTYLDPDIQLFRPLEAVRAGLAEAQICLTPHRARPLPEDGTPTQADLDRAGRFNLGFLAVRDDPKVAELLDWWAERCRFDCRVDFAAGLFVDQKWMDAAPDRVERAAILTTPALNLAYWSLPGHELSGGPGDWRVDGEPLAFFHFSGFDPRRPGVLSKHQTRIRVRPGSPLAALLADYARALESNGFAAASGVAYAHAALADGRRLTPLMRRTALAAAREGHIFEDLGQATSRWFDETLHPGVTRLMAQAGREHEGAAKFSLKTRDGRAALRRWFLDHVEPLGVDARSLAAAQSAGPGGDADRGIAARFADDPDGLLAWRLGPEAAAGRFEPAGLAPETLARLAADPAIPARAAGLLRLDGAGDLQRSLFAAFGAPVRARWPESLCAPLQAPWLARWPGQPRPFVRLFQAIWESRPDVRTLYPMRGPLDRLKFLRWLVAGGLAENGVELSALPAQVRDHPAMRLARWTVGRRR